MRQPDFLPNQQSNKSRWRLFFSAFLSLFLAIVFTAQSFVYRNNNAKFDDPVARVSGVIDGVQMSSGHNRTYRIAYHFDAPDGRHRTNVGATIVTGDRLNTGDTVPVKYLPGDPSDSRLDLPREDTSHNQEVWIDLVAGIGALAGAGFLFWKWLQA